MKPICLLPPIKFLLKRVYGLEDNDVWRIPRWLFSAKKSLIANGMVLAISESPLCLKLSIKFLLKKIYGLEEDVGWKIPRWLFSDWPSLICEWGDLSYSESLCCLTHPTKFLLKRIYGLEEMLFKEQQDGWIWKISIWLVTSSYTVLMIQATLALCDILMEWFQLFCVSDMPAAPLKVSVQEDTWFGRWISLKNSKMAV